VSCLGSDNRVFRLVGLAVLGIALLLGGAFSGDAKKHHAGERDRAPKKDKAG
jgi:hypothetical protein